MTTKDKSGREKVKAADLSSKPETPLARDKSAKPKPEVELKSTPELRPGRGSI